MLAETTLAAGVAFAKIGECPLLYEVGVNLYRASLGCPHFSCATFINRSEQSMMDGQLQCVQCTAEDLHVNNGKLKGLLTPSLLKAYVEGLVMEPLVAQKILLKLLKTHGMEVLLTTDAQYISGSKRCPRPTCEAWVDHPWQHGCHHISCKQCMQHALLLSLFKLRGKWIALFRGSGWVPNARLSS